MRRSMRRKTKPRPRRVTKTNRATNRSLKPRAKRSHQPREGVQHSDPKTLGMWFISRSVWSQRSWVCIAGNLWWMSRGRTCNGPRCYVCYVAVLMSPCVSIDVKSSSGTSIFLAWPINYMMILFSRCILVIQHMFLDWNLRILNLFFGNGVYMLSNTVCHGLERNRQIRSLDGVRKTRDPCHGWMPHRMGPLTHTAANSPTSAVPGAGRALQAIAGDIGEGVRPSSHLVSEWRGWRMSGSCVPYFTGILVKVQDPHDWIYRGLLLMCIYGHTWLDVTWQIFSNTMLLHMYIVNPQCVTDFT